MTERTEIKKQPDPQELQKAEKRKGGNGEDKRPDLEGLKKTFGADKIEARDREGNLLESTDPGAIRPEVTAGVTEIQRSLDKQRLAALIDGKMEPPNEFVAYLLDRVRAGNEEFAVTQQNIQQLNQRLGQLQKRAIQIQGEQNKYIQDIQEWVSRKPTGERPKEEIDE